MTWASSGKGQQDLCQPRHSRSLQTNQLAAVGTADTTEIVGSGWSWQEAQMVASSGSWMPLAQLWCEPIGVSASYDKLLQGAAARFAALSLT